MKNDQLEMILLQLPIYIVDAFTDLPFTGNQAGVCIVEQDISDKLMQNIATELNLSETAFFKSISPENNQESDQFKLRWFTPTQEVKMCGHATLASDIFHFTYHLIIEFQLVIFHFQFTSTLHFLSILRYI